MKHHQSDPELKALWISIRKTWFPELSEIDNYRVIWSSRRQKRTLASCNIKSQRIVVARELNHAPVKIWLEPILYHEMCHAVLKSRLSPSGRRMWHDAPFRVLENQHPMIPAMNDWIRSGGWFKAILSERSRSFWNGRGYKVNQPAKKKQKIRRSKKPTYIFGQKRSEKTDQALNALETPAKSKRQLFFSFISGR